MAETLPIDEAAIEQMLGQVRGVLAVGVVTDAQGPIDEIHVVGTPERGAKAMVRDVESLLYVRGGVRLDHRKISLVQMVESAIQPTVARLQLLDLAWSASDQQPAVSITLGLGEQQVQGVGRSRPDTTEPPELLVGYATIHALGQLIGARGQLRIDNLQLQPFGALEVCLSHLSLVTDEGVETLLGISVVRDGNLAAVARSVLDAVNRRLQRLLGGERGAVR
jgi:hypothetical protein